MIILSIKPITVTCNTIIRGYCRSVDASRAAKFLNKTQSQRFFLIQLRTIHFDLDGFVREENMDKALDLVNEMVNQGLSPDVISYNTILDGFCKFGRMQEANMLYRKMVERGINPDRSTYTSLINGHVSQDNMKEAFRFHDEMLQRGFIPDDKF